MTKYEKLAALIHLPVEFIENDFDKGMIDILIELNKKNYFTTVCCEGHLRRNNTWDGYIGFENPYDFVEYPKDFASTKNRKYYYWNGVGEDSRIEFLNNLLEWAKSLPKRPLVEVKFYTLFGINKRSGKQKILKRSYDFEDIRAEMNRKDIVKYDTYIEEKIIKRY